MLRLLNNKGVGFDSPPFTMSCNICNTRLEHLQSDLYLCCQCNHVQSSLGPDEAIYDINYHNKYEKYEKSDLNTPIQRIRVDLVRDYCDGMTLLDFGSGNGSFLRALNGHLKAEGFDINPHSGKLRFDNLFADYDAVTFWDTLEHVRNPRKVITSIDAEYVFICTPCTDDIDLDDMIEWRHYRPTEHLHYFSEQSMEKFLDVCGYDILEVNFDESEVRRGGKDKNLITVVGKKRC